MLPLMLLSPTDPPIGVEIAGVVEEVPCWGVIEPVRPQPKIVTIATIKNNKKKCLTSLKMPPKRRTVEQLQAFLSICTHAASAALNTQS
jgi:hypothetical protein